MPLRLNRFVDFANPQLPDLGLPESIGHSNPINRRSQLIA